MSMLAERKQKQRWYLNPRANKEWAEDGSKFGQRMLEKMGWTAGKGLGANEDGMTENIRVKYKNDVQGIGYQLRDDQWTQHENNFTQLLANLGSGEEASKINLPKSDKSLEKKSQSSRARVHYHKFTRGKDLASKSEKDLANIFGRKTLEKPVKQEVKEESDNEEKETKEFGVTTIKSGNMTEYFKSKLSKLSGKFSSTTNKKDNEESESEIGTTAGFGFNTDNKSNKQQFINFVSSNNAKTNNISDESESEINTTMGFGFSSPNKMQNFVSFVSPAAKKDEETEEQKIGMKRKRDEIEVENVPKDKKKKKNKKKNVAFDNIGNDINIAEEVCYDNPCLNDEVNEEDKTTEIGFDNLAFNPNDEQDKKKRKSVTFASPLAEYSTIGDSPKKKKNKKKKLEIGIDNPACGEHSFEETSQTNLKRKNLEEPTPNKKSKKKKKYVNITEENNSKAECSSTPSEEFKKSKKKKKNINSEVDNSSFEQTPKKDKKRKLETGINNLACEDSPVNCIDNLACSVNLIEEGIESITNAIDNYQTELENEMNIRKDKKLQKERKLNNRDVNQT